MKTLSSEDIASFVETQLAVWPLAKQNYDALRHAERRPVKLGDLEAAIQCNPARIKSTGAKIDKDSIAKRACFLCRDNRPKEQLIHEIHPGWEMLVNPYPILPIHLTIVATEHRPQSAVPDDIVEIAAKLPGMAVFFNGAQAGASAPDHMHLQAVLKDELPLLRLAEKIHTSANPGVLISSQTGLSLPYLFISGIVSPDDNGLPTLAAGLKAGGLSENGKLDNPELVNTFFWIDNEGLLRFVVVPRRAHRPQCYFREDDRQRVISPGCIDMAGLIIAPRKSDFDTLTEQEIRDIYSEVALPNNI